MSPAAQQFWTAIGVSVVVSCASLALESTRGAEFIWLAVAGVWLCIAEGFRIRDRQPWK